MKRIRFDIPGKDSIKVEIPENWEELTVKQAIALNLKTFKADPLVTLERLSGVEGLRDLQLDDSHKVVLDSVTRFLASPPPDLMTKNYEPHIEVLGKRIRIPSDLKKESFGQYVRFKQLADQDRALSMIIALYLQPLIDGKHTEKEERLEEISYEFDEMRFVEVFPIVNFFFSKLRKFKIYGTAA